MDRFSSTSAIKLVGEITPTSTSKFFLQLADTEFRLPTTHIITEYEGLRNRCKQEGDNIICVIPTNSHETLALLLVILQNPSIAENLSFFNYLDKDIPNVYLNVLGARDMKLYVPYIIDTSSFSYDEYFVAPVELPPNVLNSISYCLFDKKYIPYSLSHINGEVEIDLFSYAVQYIHSYEVYCSSSMKLEPILYTNQFDTLQSLPNKKYKQCWTNHLRSTTIVKRKKMVKAPRSYLETEYMIKGKLKTSKHWNAIKTILKNNWGVVTGGFIAGCIFGTIYNDIDICIDTGIDPLLIKALFDGHNIIEKKNNRFKVDDLDIFFSDTNYVHTISRFHFSVVRAFYDGEHLYMFPSCLISIMNKGIIHVNHRSIKPKHVESYLNKGYMFEKDDVEEILGSEEKTYNIVIQHLKDNDGSFNMNYTLGDIAQPKKVSVQKVEDSDHESESDYDY